MEVSDKKEGMGFQGELTITRLSDGKVFGPFKNKVVSSSGHGRNLLLRRLAGDTTYEIQISSAQLGTGTTAASDSDTGLQTPTVTGILLTDASANNNILTINVFMADADLANGTYKEMGFFIQSQLFSRILISPNYTKSTGVDTLFTYTLTATG